MSDVKFSTDAMSIDLFGPDGLLEKAKLSPSQRHEIIKKSQGRIGGDVYDLIPVHLTFTLDLTSYELCISLGGGSALDGFRIMACFNGGNVTGNPLRTIWSSQPDHKIVVPLYEAARWTGPWNYLTVIPEIVIRSVDEFLTMQASLRLDYDHYPANDIDMDRNVEERRIFTPSADADPTIGQIMANVDRDKTEPPFRDTTGAQNPGVFSGVDHQFKPDFDLDMSAMVLKSDNIDIMIDSADESGLLRRAAANIAQTADCVRQIWVDANGETKQIFIYIRMDLRAEELSITPVGNNFVTFFELDMIERTSHKNSKVGATWTARGNGKISISLGDLESGLRSGGALVLKLRLGLSDPPSFFAVQNCMPTGQKERLVAARDMTSLT